MPSGPPIVLPIQLDNQISTEGLIDCGSTSDFISQKIVNGNPSALRPCPMSSPSLLHNALSKKPVHVNKELLTKVKFQSPVNAKIKSPTHLQSCTTSITRHHTWNALPKAE